MKKKIYALLIFSLFGLSLSLQAQNMSLDFDGTNDYVVTSNNMDLDNEKNLTLEAWIYVDAFAAGDYDITSIIGIEEAPEAALIRLGDPGVNPKLAKNKLQFVISIGGTQYKLNGVTALKTNTWYHVAAVHYYDNDNDIDLRLYLNGVLESSQYYNNNGDFDATGKFHIGAMNSATTPNRFFNGKIDEVKVWNSTRSAIDIRADMYKEIAGSESNLVAYYKLNETSGTTADNAEGTGNLDGILHNMTDSDWVPSSAFFGPKNCLDFDANDDYCHKNSNVMSNTDNFTMMAWVKMDVNSANWACIVYNGNDAGGYGIGIENSKIKGLFGTIAWHETNETLTTGKWYHIAMRRSNGVLKFLLNGKLLHYTSSAVPNAPSSRFSIGNMFNADDTPLYKPSFDGQIDEVRVYDIALTDAQIQEAMCKTLLGNEANLVAYYNFDNTSGTKLQSFDGTTSNDLTLVNMSDDDWVTSTAINTWLNTNTTTWTTAANWSRGSTPVSTDNVGVYNFSNDPASSANLSMNNFYLDTDANFNFTGSIDINSNAFLNSSITIGSNESMTVDGMLAIANVTKSTNLTIASGGSLITNDTIIGSAIIKRTISDNDQWHLISVPNNNTTSNTFSGDYLQTWDETTASWNEVTETTTALIPLQGYGFWGMAKSTTHSFEGKPNTGNQSIALSYTAVADSTRDGANCLGNPYPSSIDWDGLRATYGAINYWTGTQYATWNGSGTGTNGGVQYIPPMQGFFIVRGASGPSTFSLANSNRTHSGASAYFKNAEELPNNSLMLRSICNAGTDELFIRFDENTSQDFELQHDAYKFFSNSSGLSELFSFSGIDKLSIDVRPETEIIQLGFKNNLNGVYKIGIKEIKGIANVILEDTKTDVFYPLQNGDYEFTWNITDAQTRFKLHLNATGIGDLISQNTRIFAYQKTINICSVKKLNNAQVGIFDMMGRVVYEQYLVDGLNESIEVPLGNGVYLVQLVSDQGTLVEKIILR